MVMKKVMNNGFLALALLFVMVLVSCSSAEKRIGEKLVGRYTSTSENEFDHFRDTVELRALDGGLFDVQTIANWSAAKEDDPQRPNKNKVAGVWNSYGPGETEVADLQLSDTTLRITEPMTGTVKIIAVHVDDHTLEKTLRDGTKRIYTKIQ
jgi:hypothetical protein